MNREQRIDAIIQFVQAHPESVASRAICRRMAGPGYYAPDDGANVLQGGLATADEETLTGLFDLVK